MRPSFEQIYMRLAKELAERSTCVRLHVGCVITTTDFRKVIAVGYNGSGTGLTNGCDREEPGNCGCLHAEDNACINCDSPRQTDKVVFVTHSPCVGCCKRLINLGNVKKLYYNTEYRDLSGLELLKQVGIDVQQLS